MNWVSVRFYGRLNDLIRQNHKHTPFRHCFQGQPSVKDLIESLGVPHPEIDLILVDGESAGFSRKIIGGEHISVYPAFMSLDLSGTTKIRPEPLSELCFLLDDHLGKLTSLLRMIGFDALNTKDLPDLRSAEALYGTRMLLTRNKNLLKHSMVIYGAFIRERDPVQQLVEVLNRFNLFDKLQPFTRCMVCNEQLVPVSREKVYYRLPSRVRNSLEDFYLCSGCERIYWKGTHYHHMKSLINEIREMS